MRKHIAIASVLTFALGLSACTPPAESEAATEEAAEAVEATDADAVADGTMTGEASAEEVDDEGADATGTDQDGNPIHN